MDKTPAHIKWVRGPNRRISHYKGELVKVQTLFYERRYKQCIAVCEQLQRSEIHALHQAFLWFYHAISNESIGLLAHNFSQNKLRFLDSARESLHSAMNCLPLPYVSTETGAYKQPENSPRSPYAGRVLKADHEILATPTFVTRIPLSVSSGSVYSAASSNSDAETARVIDDASPEKQSDQDVPTVLTRVEQEMCQSNRLAVPTTPATHKSRLSRVLSTPQALQEELVPSPLFSRNAKRARVPQPSNSSDIPRPLPPLPFNHNSTFKIQGTRIIQDPLLRKTAVQTLIARFEGILPLPPSTPGTVSHSMSITPGITTPRFRMIHDAFSPDPHNEHLEAYLHSSATLSGYNAHLADFRAQLRKHIAYVDGEIARVQKLQAERNAARALGPKQRFASFWSFEVVAASLKSPCPSRCHGARANEEEDDGQGEDAQDAKAKAKNERIEKLRREGWRVCKEAHGFKSVEYYNELASRVEAELT